MKTIATILVIFIAQCTYLYAEPKPGLKEDVGDFLHSNSCIFGVKSISIFMHDRHNPEGKEFRIGECCDDVDPSKPVVFIVHGFTSSANTSNFRKMTSRLILKNYTIFVVDWAQGACTNGIPILKLLAYPNAAQNTRDVAHAMASSVISLSKKYGIPLEKFTFIGHSLGAHVCGFAGKDIQESGTGIVPLIIAADPANPMFGHKECKDRVCHSDAKRLVVLHTSSLGIFKDLGDLDLQFNNGMVQPGCDVLNVSCSHGRSNEYIIDMLEDNCGFLGVPIKKRSMLESAPSPPGPETKDCIVVNSKILDHDNPMKGRYYVFVNSAEPHCTQETYSCQQQ